MPYLQKKKKKKKKNALISAFLQAEFISLVKKVQNLTVSMKTIKRIEKWFTLVVFVNCLRYLLNLLSRVLEKFIKYVFLDGKNANKAKLEFFKFIRNRLSCKAIAFDEIGRN